jgi:hypothetical protein
VTGVVNGEVREEIPKSLYFDETITIFSPADSYSYKIAGTDEGSYGLEVNSVENEKTTTFTATEIPTTPGTIHDYSVDWDALSENKQGVTVQIDADGDTNFEKAIFADNELTKDEFMDITREAFDLHTGWNLISLNVQPAHTAVAIVLEPINGKYISVWAYQDASWNVYDPLHSGFTDLTTMSSGLGYWINMKEPAFITFSGNASTSSIPLTAGWNLVGYNADVAKAITNALASIAGNYISVWAYINGGCKVYDPANPGLTDLTIMEPGYGYWIKTTHACTWTLP